MTAPQNYHGTEQPHRDADDSHRAQPGTSASNELAALDRMRLVSEVDRLIGRGIPLAMAVVSGKLDPAACREMKNAIDRMADYVAWGICGPTCIVVFSATLLRGLQPLWNELSRRAPELVAGVAISHEGMDHSELLHAARLAHSRSLAQRTRLTVLDAIGVGHD